MGKYGDDRRARLLRTVDLGVPADRLNCSARGSRVRIVLSGVTFSAILVYALLALTGNSAYSLVLLFVVVGTVIAGFVLKQRDKREVERLLYEQCDVDKAIACIVARFAEPRQNRCWLTYYYQVADWLINGGRFDDARRVIELMEEGCGDGDADGAFRINLLKSKFYYLTGNLKELNRCSARLRDIAGKRKPAGIYGYLYGLCREYPELVRSERNGDYESVYDYYTGVQESTTSVVPSVAVQFQLYRMACKLGMSEMAERHLTYLRAKGANTWYLREANRLAAA